MMFYKFDNKGKEVIINLSRCNYIEKPDDKIITFFFNDFEYFSERAYESITDSVKIHFKDNDERDREFESILLFLDMRDILR